MFSDKYFLLYTIQRSGAAYDYKITLFHRQKRQLDTYTAFPPTIYIETTHNDLHAGLPAHSAQNTAKRTAKGRLLHDKRPPFDVQKTAFR